MDSEAFERFAAAGMVVGGHSVEDMLRRARERGAVVPAGHPEPQPDETARRSTRARGEATA